MSLHLDNALAPASQARLCAICHKQAARYTCPVCNLRFCSSECYRSNVHDACSEAFFRNNILEDITSAPGRSNDEKRVMLEMLQRLESSALDDTARDGTISDEDGEGDTAVDLETRLEGVDLETITPQDLAALLSPEQKAELDAILKDPQGLADLLSNEVAVEPWWQGPNADPDVSLQAELPPVENGSRLLYNIVAVLLAYVRVVRRFGLPRLTGCSEASHVLSMLQRLIPFAFENSKTVLQDSAEAVAYVFSRSDDEVSLQERLLALEDVEMLLTRRRVTTSDTLVPYETAFKALMDAYNVLTGSAKRKILFYAAIVHTASGPTFATVQQAFSEMAAELRTVLPITGTVEATALVAPPGRQDETSRRPLIEEMT